MTMNELIMKAREKKCSDIHISEGMPVSFRIHGQPNITQTSVNVTAGMTFAVGLRALLRQDPDIIIRFSVLSIYTIS